MNRKDIARALDRAALRAECVNAIPATGKQCWYLAGLIEQANDENTYSEFLMNTSIVLTKRKASGLIERYLG